MTDKPPPSPDEVFAAIGRMTAEAARSPQPSGPDALPLVQPADEDVLELTEAIEPAARPLPTDEVRSVEPIDPGAVAEYRAAVERVGAVIGASYAEAEARARGPQPAVAPSAAVENRTAEGRQVDDRTVEGGMVEGRTVEGLVADLLRPLLREWLDANLPRIVERAVADRVARAGRDRAQG